MVNFPQTSIYCKYRTSIAVVIAICAVGSFVLAGSLYNPNNQVQYETQDGYGFEINNKPRSEAAALILSSIALSCGLFVFLVVVTCQTK